MTRGVLLVTLTILAGGCGRIAFDGVPGSGVDGANQDGGGDDGAATTADAIPDLMPPSTPGPSDFVVYWDFETQGAAGNMGVWPDYTATREALCTQPDCPASGMGKYDFGAAMSGSDRLVISSEPRLQSGSPFTVSIWFNLSTVPASGSCLVSKLVGAGTANSWQVCVSQSNQLTFTSSANGISNSTVGPVSAGLDAWHHVAILWDGSGKRVRVDGSLGSTTSSAATAFDGGDILLGFDIDNGTPQDFIVGALDELKIYDRALSIDELDALAER